jgi:hypothetical protein
MPLETRFIARVSAQTGEYRPSSAGGLVHRLPTRIEAGHAGPGSPSARFIQYPVYSPLFRLYRALFPVYRPSLAGDLVGPQPNRNATGQSALSRACSRFIAPCSGFIGHSGRFVDWGGCRTQAGDGPANRSASHSPTGRFIDWPLYRAIIPVYSPLFRVYRGLLAGQLVGQQWYQMHTGRASALRAPDPKPTEQLSLSGPSTRFIGPCFGFMAPCFGFIDWGLVGGRGTANTSGRQTRLRDGAAADCPLLCQSRFIDRVSTEYRPCDGWKPGLSGVVS